MTASPTPSARRLRPRTNGDTPYRSNFGAQYLAGRDGADNATRYIVLYLSTGVISTTRCLVTGCSLWVLTSAIPHRTFSSGM